MLRSVRATAPAALVPLAWSFAAAAHTGLLTPHTVFVGHVVVTALLIAFAGLSWREMQTNAVLRAWLGIVVAGVPITIAGGYGVVARAPVGTHAAVFGWMLLPAFALVPTARRVGGVDGPDSRYTLAAALSGFGAAAFLLAALTGRSLVLPAIALAGAGQTLSIVVAVWDAEVTD